MKPARNILHTARLARRLTLALVVTGLAAAGPAQGSQTAASDPPDTALGVTTAGMTSDPDDTLGRLDIARVQHRATAIDRDHVLVSYRVRVLTPFGTTRLDGIDRNFVLELNRDSVRGAERNVTISSHNGRLLAEVISNATREVITTVHATRPNDHAVQISGPRRILGARSYFWTSNFHADRSPGCSEENGFPIVCQDTVPQRGWVRLDRPAWPE